MIAIRLFSTLLILSLAACGSWDEEESKLTGERISIRDTQAITSSTSFVAGLPLPETIANEDWLEHNMSPSHEGFHLSLAKDLKEIWRADVGDIAEKDALATTAPVGSKDTLYFLNAESVVFALDIATGQKKWSVNLTPENEDSENGFGGGLSLSDNKLFASTGFGEVIALSPEAGEVLWRSRTSAPIRSAPTVYKGKVVVVARDNTAFAFDSNTGQSVWQVNGAATGAAFLGGASAAAAGQIAVLPFASGEILAVDIHTGSRGWAQVLSGGQRGAALSTINDISSDPVLHNGNVYVANQSGQLSAYQASTGKSQWTRRIGAYNAGWITGDSIYLVTSDARLMRILTKTGESVWEKVLPLYADEDSKENVIIYGGPVVANSRIYLTSSKDGLVVHDAENGSILETSLLQETTHIPPIVIQQTLFVIGGGGNLHAFR